MRRFIRDGPWNGILVLAIGGTIGLAASFAFVSAPDAPPAVASPSVATQTYVPNIAADETSEPAVSSAAPTASPAPSAAAISLDSLHVAVPRLGIDLPLALGDVGRDVPRPGYAGNTPERVALIFPSTHLPGENGNSYIYAHARAGMFLSLWSARIGDQVVIYRPDSSVRLIYSIVQIEPRVDPTDTRWLESGGRERVTLQTSTGPNPGDPRFIVVAYPTGSPESASHP